MKSYRYTGKDAVSDFEAYTRTLRASRTMRALPDKERRFLAAGTKSSWPEYLHDFADLVAQADLEEEGEEPKERITPTRADIADVLVAGKWFASLALLPDNAEEFRRAVRRFRRTGKPARVNDQRIVEMHANGATLRFIGQHLKGEKLNEHQVERRIYEIAANLGRIANGRACLIHSDDGTRRAPLGGGKAQADLA